MKIWNVEFSYSEPRWGDATIPAETELEAREEFDLYLKEFYPEAIDVEVINIKEEVNVDAN